MSRLNNTHTTTRTIISLFLAFILIVGTIITTTSTVSVYGQGKKPPLPNAPVTQDQLQQILANYTTHEELQEILNQIEACPAGTIYEGFFVNGDGDPFTTVPEDEVMTERCIQTAQLNVIKTTTCDVEQFGQEFCDSIREPKISVLGNNPTPSFFFGTETSGTNVSLGQGAYHVDEAGFTEGLEPCKKVGFDGGRNLGDGIFICTNFSDECQGDITIGNPQTCTIENVLVERPPLLINKNWFVCNDLDCTIETSEQQITSFQGPGSGNYTECTSEQDCPFVNDAGFNINITGNNPTPNTIPAQVNTVQEVDIGAGAFKISEELFSNALVPNVNFDVENVPVGQDISPFLTISFIIAFDEAGQRVFTANTGSDSVSIIDLANANTVTNVPLAPSGGDAPTAIAFDEAGQRVFTANFNSDSVSIIDLANANTVTNVPLAASGGDTPTAIAFDETGQRVFTANDNSDSVSIIDLANANTVTNVPLAASGGDTPRAITFDEAGQRVFTANFVSHSVSIIDLANANTVTNVPLTPTGGNQPLAITFDEAGQRVFTANTASSSVSIIDLANANTVTNVPLASSGGIFSRAIAFDEAGQRVFTANFGSSSVSIIDLNNANTVTNVPLAPSGGFGPIAIAFDEAGQRVFTANLNSHSVSIIDLTTTPATVTNLPLAPSGGFGPLAIAFDEAGQRVFTANQNSDSVSIINLPTVAKICQDSGFDTGDIRTFVSNGQTIQQITCVNFVGECSGEIEDGETRECTVQDYVVAVYDVSNNDDASGINILADSNKPEQKQQQQILTNDNTITKESTAIKNIIQQIEQEQQIEQNTQKDNNIMSLPSFPFILDIPTS